MVIDAVSGVFILIGSTICLAYVFGKMIEAFSVTR